MVKKNSIRDGECEIYERKHDEDNAEYDSKADVKLDFDDEVKKVMNLGCKLNKSFNITRM